MSFCGGPLRATGLEVSPFLCAWCDGIGRWASGETCHACGGGGQVPSDREKGVNSDGAETRPVRLAKPPGVMAAPCADCAFRPGSPEELGDQPPADIPFHCHHGLTRVGDGYVSPVYLNGAPVGALVCAGWWAARIDGKPLPRVAFTDPGGSDRTASAPKALR